MQGIGASGNLSTYLFIYKFDTKTPCDLDHIDFP